MKTDTFNTSRQPVFALQSNSSLVFFKKEKDFQNIIGDTPNFVDEWLALSLSIRGYSHSYLPPLGHRTAMSEVFRGFYEHLCTNADVVPQVRLQSLLFAFCLIHY